MSLSTIARHRGNTKKPDIATFDEWMAMGERLDEEEIMDRSESEGKEEDRPEEEELLPPRKRPRIDVPHPVCVVSFLSCRFRYELFNII